MYIPEKILAVTGDMPYTADTVGCSGDSVLLFEGRYVLKISTDPGRLLREREKTDWISEKIPGPKNVLFLSEGGKQYYLRTCVCGDSLISPRFLSDPELLTDMLCKAVCALRSLDGAACPFRSSDSEGSDFVHGDLCLPNIYIDSRNEIAGFIDTENAGLGDRWYDYSWMLWSLSYNLKTDRYGKMLLDKLGLVFDREKYESYIPEDYR